jgi:hypothetical protein
MGKRFCCIDCSWIHSFIHINLIFPFLYQQANRPSLLQKIDCHQAVWKSLDRSRVLWHLPGDGLDVGLVAATNVSAEQKCWKLVQKDCGSVGLLDVS